MTLSTSIMKLLTRLAVFGWVLSFFFAQVSSAKTFNVSVGTGGDYFSPASVTVEVGDKVEWDWNSSFH